MTLIPRPTHSWIALKPCGCIHNAILYDRNHLHIVVSTVAGWLRAGYEVYEVPNSVVTAELSREVCPCKALEAGKRQAAQEYAVNQQIVG